MLGYSLIIIAPPTSNCLYCKKSLTENNEPTQVQLHTRLGTNIATKYSLRCRNCKEARQHTGSLFGPSHDMHYHPTKYGNNMDGYKEYTDSYHVSIIKATISAYVEELFAKQYFSEFHHGWMSSQAKTEAFNEANRGTYQEKQTIFFWKLIHK